jgi:hypothetical protein
MHGPNGISFKSKALKWRPYAGWWLRWRWQLWSEYEYDNGEIMTMMQDYEYDNADDDDNADEYAYNA